MTDKRSIAVKVNGQTYEREVDTRMTLVDFLRHELDLTGTHVGCEHGVCGACTVLVNGESVRSCLMLAVQANEQSIQTVEGLAVNGELNILQQCFQDHHSLQCGFCTSGMLMTLTEFLRDHPNPTQQEVQEVLSGNLCRCTGYLPIMSAAMDAAQKMREAQS
jgi:carbon-monoxide dehydrogenase small subunit